jgi:hypothetical protein
MKKRKKASSDFRKAENSKIGKKNKKLFIFLLILLIIALVLVIALIYAQSSNIREKGFLYSIGNFFSFKWLYSEGLSNAYDNGPKQTSGCDKVTCKTYELGDGPKGPNGEKLTCGTGLSDGCSGKINCPCGGSCKTWGPWTKKG